LKTVIICFGIILFTVSNIFAAKPQWVETCGNPAQFPSNRYLTGFGVSSVNDRDLKSKMESAKRMAYMSLAESVRLRIVSSQSSSIDVLSNKNGPVTEIYRSQIVVSSLMDLQGISVFFYHDRKEENVYALAVLDKKKTAEYYYKKTQSLIFQLQRSDTSEWERDSDLLLEAVGIMAKIRECRLFSEIVVSPWNGDDPFVVEAYEKKAGRLLDKISVSIDELVSKLIGKIYERIMILDGKVLITPFYKCGSVELSVLGSKVSGAIKKKVSSFTGLEQLEKSDDVFLSENAAVFQAQKCGADYLIRGTYSIDSSKGVLFELQVVDVGSKTVLAGSQGVLSFDTIWESECVTEGTTKRLLDVEIETSRGKDNLVFEDGEEFQIYVEVNKPCYLLLIHGLPDGLKAVPELAYQNYYIGLSEINRPYPLPDTFSVAPPFGEESISVYVSEAPFPQLQIVNRVIDGRLYRTVTGEIQGSTQRGVQVKNNSSQVIKKSLKFTSIPR
jgi:hypothetical protein